MNLHVRPRLAARLGSVCAAALALLPLGCLNPNLYPYPPYPYPPPPPADKSAAPPVDNRYAGPQQPVSRAQYLQQAGDPPGSVQLPQPNLYPGGQPQQPQPGAGGYPLHPNGYPLPPNPNVRTTPSLYGEKLPLGPNEFPLDKALELTRRMDDLAFENKQLIARIRTLEADGKGREAALTEAMREVITATDEVMKARTDMQTLRTELAALRERVKQVEKDELDTLRKVITALEKLVAEK